MTIGVSVETLVARYPRAYHMAAAGSWDSIQRHGLLSTQALMDLFEVDDASRSKILSHHRPDCVQIHHPRIGSAIIRDQKPMDDRGLTRALQGGLTPRDWYELINGKVFFWLTEARLNTLRHAKEYAKNRQTILTCDTAKLLGVHGTRSSLSPINSGCTKPMPHPRGTDTFLPLGTYPYEALDRKRRPRDPVAELAISYAVPDIRDHIVHAIEEGGGQPTVVLYPPNA